MTKLMIYGAAGYTGRMVSAHAEALGLDFVIAGNPQNEAGLAALAGERGVQY